MDVDEASLGAVTAATGLTGSERLGVRPVAELLVEVPVEEGPTTEEVSTASTELTPGVDVVVVVVVDIVTGSASIVESGCDMVLCLFRY